MKILQLSPQFPLPADNGGRIGIYNIFKEFAAAGHEVTFVCYSQNADPNQIKIAEKYGNVKIINHSTENTPKRIFKSLLCDVPIYLAKHFDKNIEKELEKIISNENFDVIHADHSCMAAPAFFVKRMIKKPIGLRLHNLEYRIWRRYANALPKYTPKQLYVNDQGLKLKAAEIKIFGEVDICFAITENDKRKVHRLNPKAKVTVASAGVNTEDWQVEGIDRNLYEMILATAYDWVHNVDGAKWFVEKVLPIIRKKIPDAFLTMLGKNLPEWFAERKNKGVNPIGYVDDVRPYFNRANIYVAPLFVGGGIRIKILEALAMELPVIATRISAEGINDNYTNGIYVSDRPEDFAKIIIDLMKNPNAAREIGKNGRIFVQENYSWKNNVEIMLNEYEKLVLKYNKKRK